MGIALLGVVAAETLSRWNFQVRQERALFQGGPAASVDPAPKPQPQSVEWQGPPQRVTERIDLPAAPAAAPSAVAATASKSAEATAASAPSPRIGRPVTNAFGRIEIPRLGVGVIVKEGADDETLARAVGLVPGSARPGEIGNTVLAGHRDTFFRPLRKIAVNDRIRVVVPPNTYEYEVQSVRIVEPEETSVLQSRGVEELTLVTCYPFRFLGTAPERFIVSAARVN